jgi:hypothetical protein
VRHPGTTAAAMAPASRVTQRQGLSALTVPHYCCHWARAGFYRSISVSLDNYYFATTPRPPVTTNTYNTPTCGHSTRSAAGRYTGSKHTALINLSPSDYFHSSFCSFSVGAELLFKQETTGPLQLKRRHLLTNQTSHGCGRQPFPPTLT